ncbi:MAG: S41 family peptidase [Bacteroidota bacterium]
MKHLLFLISFIPAVLIGQNCDCSAQMDFLIKTFSENDAGFQYVLDQKGDAAYQQHNQAMRAKAKQTSNAARCHEIMIEWTAFFRAGHIGIVFNPSTAEEAASANPSKAEIRAMYQDAPRLEVDIPAFKSYVAGLEDPGLEGIWQSGNYTVGIKKEGEDHIGFVINADSLYWFDKQIKLTVYGARGKGMEYLMRDHSVQKMDAPSLIGRAILQTGWISWQRVFPEIEPEPEAMRYISLMQTDAPVFQEISDQTTLLRIPSFNIGNKAVIDSLIATHHDALASHPNLIIDLRDNGGGSDASYGKLIPYLYTNPIRVVGVELLSTPLNNGRMEQFMSHPDFSESDRAWAKESLDKLNEHLGEFVNLNDGVVDMVEEEKVMPYPEQVAILINENNGSTTEQFLLAAKQSKKVKLFGTTTTGVLDISNMHNVPFPDPQFTLWYSLSRSMRIPHMTIDGKGIQPDYYLADDIPPYHWISHVEDILNQ